MKVNKKMLFMPTCQGRHVNYILKNQEICQKIIPYILIIEAKRHVKEIKTFKNEMITIDDQQQAKEIK